MKKVRVLLADEHPPLLHHLSALLSDDFCVVGTVSDGQALVTEALKLEPQVIISDIDMPIMDGLEAVRQVKTLMPDIKIIFLTNRKEQEYVAAAFSARIQAVVRYSFSRLERVRNSRNDDHCDQDQLNYEVIHGSTSRNTPNLDASGL